ncbi:MAG: NUDIX domain-containing protein [Acidobacteriota bacterium]
MRAIIFGDGLAEAHLSPDDSSHPNHIGSWEVDRLMSADGQYGVGPLPTFLRAAAAGEGAEHIQVMLLDAALDVQPSNPVTDTFSARSGLSTTLRDIRRRARVIPLPSDTIPWKFLEDTVGAAARLEREEGTNDVRCLVVGSHTERRILALTLFLRTLLAKPRVAVATHLVGSATQDAHYLTLRSTLPASGVEVLLDLHEAAAFVGLDPAPFAELDCCRCAIEPAEIRDRMGVHQKRLVELLCMHWTRAELVPLKGGFSGSSLFLAEGEKANSRTEPLVLKIDEFAQMRRELEGNDQVKDFLGRNVPTLGHPVEVDDLLGVGMELAAMEGRPITLQASFEAAESEGDIRRFLKRFDKALSILTEKLYGNTRSVAWVVPYRAFGLHTEQILRWFQLNCRRLDDDAQAAGLEGLGDEPRELERVLKRIARNEDGVDSEVCLRHGDLNFSNILCDVGENLWFIDWTHSGPGPLELDFAKLENDVKFVMSKEFSEEDLDRLRRLEELLLSERMPPEASQLPAELNFIRWDLRFRKILVMVRRIREVCFELKADSDWLVYRIGLLRYALHTLSFDRRRGVGECDLTQLLHAFHSARGLILALAEHDFNVQIRGERPESYPPRQRLRSEFADWSLTVDDYHPPYYVDPAVVANDCTDKPGCWADPEDFATLLPQLRAQDALHYDAEGRPLNPAGRTGIAGRGLLGCWGRNLSVTAVVARIGQGPGQAEILLGRRHGDSSLHLPKGFMLPGENAEAALTRVLEVETGWSADFRRSTLLQNGYVYDARQTDHAWVVSHAVLFTVGWGSNSGTLRAGGDFTEVRWRPLTAQNVNRVASDQARIIRTAVARHMERRSMDHEQATSLLNQTG